MNGRRRVLHALVAVLPALAVLTAAPGEAISEPLQVRLGALSRHALVVLGVEGGQLRLRPLDSGTGEVLVALDEARDLQFVLPEAVGRAQQLAFNHRPSEALELLRPIASALLPFLGAPRTNAVPVVQQFMDLLVAQHQWEEAVTFVRPLPANLLTTVLAHQMVPVAQGLHRKGQSAAAASLVVRLELERQPEIRLGLEEFAHMLRREGHGAEAQRVYEHLAAGEDPAEARWRHLLLAYVALQQDETEQAEARLASIDPSALRPRERPLYLLLRGRQALSAGLVEEALDLLSRGLIDADGASEWRLELQALLVAAYRGAGRSEPAAAIEAGLRRLHPDSPWTRRLADVGAGVAEGRSTPWP